MNRAKIAVSIEEGLLKRLDRLVKDRRFRNRSRAIQEALHEKLERLERSCLACERAKLDSAFEQQLADQRLAADLEQWPGTMARLIINERRHILGRSLDPVRGREHAGRQPVVVISQDLFNTQSGTVIALAIPAPTAAGRFPPDAGIDDC